MKYLLLLLLLSFIGISCGGEDTTQVEAEEASPELVEEIQTVEAENETIENNMEELKSSTEELDQLLEEL